MPFRYEENSQISSFRSWLIVILFCVVIIAWGIFNYLLIPDAPRRWDMNAVRDVPGESIYSTASPAAGAPPAQIAPLPEGAPLQSGAQRESKPEVR
jgi:hypothetical protein